MKDYINKIHYNEAKLTRGGKFLFVIFSKFYSLIMNIRNFLYKLNIIRRDKLPAFVISVGNLTTGGTGKTPVTISLANYISETYGKKVAVVSRGYGGKLSNDNINLISNGEQILSTADQAGDEPYLIAHKTKDVIVLTGKNRVKNAQFAINEYNAEVIILDDGFQHLKVERDLDLLLIDLKKKFGNNKLLPMGPLRESLRSIRRADKVILVNKDDQDFTKDDYKYSSYINKSFDKKVYLCNFKYSDIYNIQTKEKMDSTVENLYAFSGIAQPEYFFDYLRARGFNLLKELVFTDHYNYKKEEVRIMLEEASELGASAIITTEKDMVKIMPHLKRMSTQVGLYALKLDLDLDMDGLLEDFMNK